MLTEVLRGLDGIDLQRRGELLQLDDVEVAGRLDAVAADHRDRQRHLLRGLLAAARGDDDHVAAGRSGGFGLVLRRTLRVFGFGGWGNCGRGRADCRDGIDPRIIDRAGLNGWRDPGDSPRCEQGKCGNSDERMHIQILWRREFGCIRTSGLHRRAGEEGSRRG